MDKRFGRLAELGAVVALIADHGMNDKFDADGAPRVIWLQDVLENQFGEGAVTVICPITDAFVGHHGALGGFVRVYCHDGAKPEQVMEAVQDIDGIARVWTAEAVADELELPLDREGDVAVMGDEGTVIGGREVDHDLSALNRHFPANLQIHGNRIYIAPPRELHSLRSPPMTRLWRADHVRKAIWQRFPPSRHTSPVFSTLPSISSAYAGTGLRRRSSIKAKIFWNKLFDTATSANWNVT